MSFSLQKKVLIGGAIAFALLVVALVSFLCWPTPFQGTWNQSGGEGDFSWYRNTTYQYHRYHAEGYPPLSESGWYWVTGQNEDTYTLKIWVEGQGEEKGHFEQQEVELINADQVRINGSEANRSF